MSDEPDSQAYIDKIMAMPGDERKALLDRQHFDMWGVTREQFWELDASEIQAIAEARGLNVAGIGKGGTYSHEGDGKDKRN